VFRKHWEKHTFYSTLHCLRLEVLRVGNAEKSKINILHAFFIIRESVTYFCIFYNIIYISLNDGTDNGKLIGDDVEGRRPRHILRLCPNICLEHAWSVFCVVLTTTAKFGLHAGNKKFNTLNEKWTCIGIIMYTSLSCIILYNMWNKKYD